MRKYPLWMRRHRKTEAPARKEVMPTAETPPGPVHAKQPGAPSSVPGVIRQAQMEGEWE